jgi:long-chain acyl-CoA synthetase
LPPRLAKNHRSRTQRAAGRRPLQSVARPEETAVSDKPWLKSYPEGVPAQIDVQQFSSLKDILEKSCQRFSARPAFSNMGVSMSYAELDRLTRDFAAFLQSLPGMKKGERVAIMMPNALQYPVALFGTLRAGMTVVNVNPLYTPRELEHQLEDSGARTIVIIENFAHTLQEVVARTGVEHVVTTQLADLFPVPKRWLVNAVVKHVKKMVPHWRIDGAIDFRQALRRGAAATFQEVPISPDDLAFLQYTGGTTGVAKGAMLTHRNMVANLQQVHGWVGGELEEGREVVVTALPLYHIFCLTANCLTFMKIGGENLLITNPRDMPGFVKTMQEGRATAMTGVNTLFNGLLNTPGFDALDFSRLKFAIGGGTAVQRAVAERWKQVTRTRLIEGYGLTESSPVACANPLNGDYNGTIGLPLPSTEACIMSDEGRVLPRWDGQGTREAHTGEICIRGPQVMKGYWNRPDETAQVLTADGFLKTGDVGHMDQRGYVTISDRKKDMILVSGFNVYPNEIEGVVAGHPGVLECAVVGVPDDKSGEAVKLVVVKKDPALTAEDVLKYCRQHMTGYKVPKVVEFRAELPKTPVGKVLRRELRGDPAKQAA